MKIKLKEVKNSRKEKTIKIILKSDKNNFSCIAPSGSSRGKHEVKEYKKSLKQDIKEILINKDKIIKQKIETFDDLIKIEKLMKNKIGGNSLYVLEACLLKKLAYENKKQLWEFLLNEFKLKKKIPYLVGNAIEGGKHSKQKKRPDFQEFLFIPETSVSQGININSRAWQNCRKILKKVDSGFKNKIAMEGGWKTSLDNEKVLIILNNVRQNMIDEFKIKMKIGVDYAASSFYKNNKYSGKNKKQYINYVLDLIKKYNIFYNEDVLNENDFLGFSLIRKKTKNLIVGDDLTTTNLSRLKKAIKNKSINALIIKPNQIGSLIEMKEVIDLAKTNKIKTIMSHRGGETLDATIADFAVGFNCDFFKSGINTKVREIKLKRLREIENF